MAGTESDSNTDAGGEGGKDGGKRRLARLCAYLDENDAAWPLVAFALLIVAGLLVLWDGTKCTEDLTVNTGSKATTFLLLLWVAWLYAWVTHCFAGDPYANRTRTIKFAYFFVILSFVAVSIMIANIGRARSFGVVEGCVASSDDSSFLPIRCDHPLRLPQPQTYPATTEVLPKDQAPIHQAAPTPTVANPAAPNPAVPNPGVPDPAPAPAVSAGAGTIVVGATRVPTFSERMANAAVNHNYHHLLNIGGRLDDIGKRGDSTTGNCPAKMIHGGVPVPVYFILLALIGAAISLARNVPVIQRRSEDEYVGTAAESRLGPGQVRELLAFQILQFVSAPFLAVAAYHTLKPESLATTVALGFLTGFASERILSLLSVRFKDTSEKTETIPVLTGAIRGEVKFAGKPVEGVAVEIESLTTLKEAKTDKSGRFTFMGVPVNAQPYRLIARVTDKDGSFRGTTNVRLDKPTEANAGTIELVKANADSGTGSTQ